MRARRETRERVRRGIRPVFYIGVGIASVALSGLVGAALFVLWGVYDVSAVQQHTAPVYRALGAALKRSISRRAQDIEVPPLDDPAMVERGFQIFRAKCVQCHGAPGVPRDDVGKGLTPLPANLVHTAREWTAAEIFWTVKNGIKMSGMPAWRFKYPEGDLWAVVAFVQTLPRYSALEYRRLHEGTPLADGEAREPPLRAGPPDPEQGQLALRHYACTACHTVPGVVGAEAPVGPPLGGMAARRYIAGVLPNTFDNMVQWIVDPPAVDPATAMPDLGVSRGDAMDMAAYLQTLE